MKDVQKAKALYKYLFGEPFPADWTIEFGIWGNISYRDKCLTIHMLEFEDALDTLVHEFVHLRHPRWKHGSRFVAEKNRLLKQVIHYEKE